MVEMRMTNDKWQMTNVFAQTNYRTNLRTAIAPMGELLVALDFLVNLGGPFLVYHLAEGCQTRHRRGSLCLEVVNTRFPFHVLPYDHGVGNRLGGLGNVENHTRFYLAD
jgi:hypothetical protein